MSLRFWILAAFYHAFLVAVCLSFVARWRRRGLARQGGSSFTQMLMMDALEFGAAAVFLAAAAAVPLPDRRFAGIRFLSQALFAETPVLVSRGVGMERGSAPQIRFLCRPEICVLTLRY